MQSVRILGAAACSTNECEVALRQALEMARMDARELDAVFLATRAPDQISFHEDALPLHQRLCCREDTFALVIDEGAGGTPYLLDLAHRMIQGGAFRTVAVLRSAFTSAIAPAPGRPALDPFISTDTIGDGAGAIVLRGENLHDGAQLAHA